MNTPLPTLTATPITRGPRHHFFGYYDKSCWDASGRWILGLETMFMDHPPKPSDVATIGMIDTASDCAWTPLAETTAWNWQQSCMLQWLGKTRKIIFNDRRDGQFISRILDTATGTEQVINRPVYGVDPTGTRAVSANFSRLHHQRPGYGYAGIPDPWEYVNVPEDDGIYAIDLVTGKNRLVLTIAEAAAFQPLPEFGGKIHRFNHLQFNTSGKRFAFLHRYKTPDEEVGCTRLMTLNFDGSDLHCLSDHGFVSHYDWCGTNSILAWARRHEIGNHYYLFQDRTSQFKILGKESFDCDGHCSFSPDQGWVLTDTYPDAEHYRTLVLFDRQEGERIDIGRFYSPPMEWQIRCDLHPRWSRDGRKVCIDSIHEGMRQMYVLDVSDVVQRG
ncbi:MAG: hypothetical protein B9S32_03640 [Verrucomicrobia bacterium Tous-C9LFEB]|nr:MAG: hypothetical protein B9S32_03640 [Verrucomicrobia bacterium Tous-C9LFEB]